ncbi:MAG: SiaB family protein kinase [Bacteroidota bacterium]
MDYLKSYRNVFDQNILLLFKGQLNFDLVTSMISTLGTRLNLSEDSNATTRKFYNIATECIQNIYYQLDELDVSKKIGTYDAKSALIMVSARKKFFSIQTGNYLPADKSKDLKKRLEEIRDLPMDELKTLYKKIIAEEDFTHKGTLGLGFIDIARKAGDEKLRYRFQEVNEKVDFFTFQIRIPRA